MSMFTRLALPICAALAFMAGCGGGGSAPAPTGTLAITLGSDSIPGCSQVVVSLAMVEGSGDGSKWFTLGQPLTTVDLMALQNGHSASILPATPVPAGTYTQFRLTWGTVNYQSAINLPAYVIPEGGTGQVLSMPVTTLVKGSVTVPANGAGKALLMFAGDQAVVAAPGASTPYRFNATGLAFDPAACGRVTGVLADPSARIAGAEVFAETLDGLGTATLVRRAVSDATGTYALDGLPAGAVYFVAALPPNYAAQAAAPGTLAAGATLQANLTFAAAVPSGTVALAITPGSTSVQGTWGELRQSVAAGSSGSPNLILRSRTMTVGSAQDTAVFLSVAPGTYGVTAERSTSGAAPAVNTGIQKAVTAGATASVVLSY